MAAILLLAACGSRETLTFESGPIPLVAEGPLFEGSNTAQGAWAPGMAAFLAAQGSSPAQLRSARIVQATLEGEDLGGIGGVTFHLASDKLDMLKVANLTPLRHSGNKAVLTVATEQKGLAEHLKEASVTVVADIDLDEDSDEDRHVIGSFTIELTIKR
jgi:hypothetical protein